MTTILGVARYSTPWDQPAPKFAIGDTVYDLTSQNSGPYKVIGMRLVKDAYSNPTWAYIFVPKSQFHPLNGTNTRLKMENVLQSAEEYTAKRISDLKEELAKLEPEDKSLGRALAEQTASLDYVKERLNAAEENLRNAWAVLGRRSPE